MVKKIIKTSFQVFALNDFNKASTNMIVKRAGISRGTLYHYFKDKEELFEFLKFYSFKKDFDEINKKINWDDDDIIRRLSDIAKYRIETLAEYPYMMEFSEKYREQIFKFVDINYLYEWSEKFYKHNIDYSKFEDKSCIKEALHIIKWTYKGLYQELLKNHDTLSNETIALRFIDECDKYYKVLATNFYN